MRLCVVVVGEIFALILTLIIKHVADTLPRPTPFPGPASPRLSGQRPNGQSLLFSLPILSFSSRKLGSPVSLVTILAGSLRFLMLIIPLVFIMHIF